MNISKEVFEKSKELVLATLTALNIEATNELVSNLLISTYVEFIKNIITINNNNEIINNLSKIEGEIQYEEFENLISKNNQYLMNIDADYSKLLTQSTLSTLNEFLSETKK